MTFQSAYSSKVVVETINNQPSRTKANLADNLDVNKIIKRFQKTGILQKLVDLEGIYGEIDSMELRDALEKVNKAENMFMDVPSKIRNMFDNDAGAFIDYATNPANIQQLRDWGLAVPLPDPHQNPAIEPETP